MTHENGKASERDWPEDFSHENGNYRCRCYMCDQTFMGHKRRVVCKSCTPSEIARRAAAPEAPSPVTGEEPVAWLHVRADRHKIVELYPLAEMDKREGWTETPLFTRPTPVPAGPEMREAVGRAMAGPEWDAKDFTETLDGQDPEEVHEYWSHKADAAVDTILAILAGQTAAGEEWQDIRTAPRDGTWFLACATAPGWGATRIVRFADPSDRFPIHGEGHAWPSAPTHWRALPPPPARSLVSQRSGS